MPWNGDRWAYRVLRFGPNGADPAMATEELDTAGSEGFELVCVDRSGLDVVFYLKRAEFDTQFDTQADGFTAR